jgi:hypothetical protein
MLPVEPDVGALGRTRTCDPRLRRPLLYPAELRAPIECASKPAFGRPKRRHRKRPGGQLVGVEGFEPPTSCSQSRRATRLRYTPVSENASRNRRAGTIRRRKAESIHRQRPSCRRRPRVFMHRGARYDAAQRSHDETTMSAQILDGKAVAAEIRVEIRNGSTHPGRGRAPAGSRRRPGRRESRLPGLCAQQAQGLRRGRLSTPRCMSCPRRSTKRTSSI